MSVAGVLDRTFDSEVDVRVVAQLSAVGSLADDVLVDLARAHAGITTLSASSAIRAAADLFEAVVRSENESANLWAGNGISDALRLMASYDPGSTTDPEAPSSENALVGLEVLASGLRAASADAASDEQLAQLRESFETMANSTMSATLASIQVRGYSSSWLTA